MMIEKEYYTVKDIAEMWQLSERTIRELITGGKLKGKKIANKFIITAQAVKDCIEQGDNE